MEGKLVAAVRCRSCAFPDRTIRALRARGLFVAEGRLVVERLIGARLSDARRHHVRSVLVSDAAVRQMNRTLAAVSADVPIFVCGPGDFLGITGHDIHRGCLALVERPAPLTLDAALSGAQCIVVLEAVTNADNVGGVFRNAMAFQADAVLLSPTCCDPLYRKAIRTSMGATLSVPFVRLEDWPDALSRVRAEGFAIVALTPRVAGPSEELDAFASKRHPPPIALLVGTEGAGLTAAVEAAADYRVRIPMRSDVDSLNLAVATGIALYSLRQHASSSSRGG